MLLTTTSMIDGGKITRYYGIVSGETIIGANVFREISLLASVTSWAGAVALMKKYSARPRRRPCAKWRSRHVHWVPTPSSASTWTMRPWVVVAPC